VRSRDFRGGWTRRLEEGREGDGIHWRGQEGSDILIGDVLLATA
jgi:hypothetical protein